MHAERPGEDGSDDAPAPPRPAATVVLLRPSSPGSGGPRVLLTQRPSTMAFGPNLHVFPGGAVDPGDLAPAAVGRSRLAPDAAARLLGDAADPVDSISRFIAGVRELWEEAGVLLADPRAAKPGSAALGRARRALIDGDVTIGQIADSLDLTLRTDLLAPISRWVTPPFLRRRFDTWFFVAELPRGAEPTFVGREVAAHLWTTPRRALDAMAAGEIALWVPTSATLQQLEHATSLTQVRDHLAPGRAAGIRLDEVADGVVRFVLPGAGAVPGQSVDAWVVGRRDLVVVDPGDPSESVAEALVALSVERSAALRAVAITSSVPDHAAGAEALALQLGLPLYGGRGSGRDLPATVVELGDGERLPVGDIDLVAVATPGPSRDHVAYACPAADFVLVGDLVGPAPSRAIPAPPDRPAWLASLDTLERLAPGRLLPAHGAEPASAAGAVADARRALSALPARSR